MIATKGFAASSAKSGLKPIQFEREPAKADELEIEVLYCGVCHSDIHQVKNEWDNTVYPCLPGHEVVGRVTNIGASVSRFKLGDIVGVGCMIDSCGECDPCRHGEENYCEGPNSWLATYNGPMVPSQMSPTGKNEYGRDNTYGGYSTSLVVKESFVLRIPSQLTPAAAAPLLCAGVTTYSPLKHWDVSAGQKVGIVGLGGLGHLAVKIAKALGAEVMVFTSSKDKFDEVQTLGATPILESDEKALKPLAQQFDFILSTVPKKHDINPFIPLLKRDCTICVVGAIEPMEPVNNMQVAFHRKNIAGSLIGSIAETQEVLDFCSKHGIQPDVELIDIDRINEAYREVEKGDVRFRYVINAASIEAA